MTTGDVIDVLTHDHREVEQMFGEFERATDPDERKRICDRVTIELVRHSVAEEEYVYPAARKALPDGDATIEHEIEEHAAAERTMNDLDGLDPTDARFGELMARLMTQIRAHVAEEEGQMFPRFAQVVSEDELMDLGQKVQTAKKLAPTRPHPAAPDHPPFNKLLNPGAALVDRVRDWLSGRGKES